MAPLEGPVGIGALVDAFLLGCVFVQSCVYYKNSRRDTWLLKVLASLILFLLLSHLGCTSAWLLASAQVNTGDASVPEYATILFGVSSILGAMILFLERCFFAHRILKASNNHLLAFAIFILCIFSFTAASGAASVFFINATANLTSQLGSGWIFPLAIISGLVCDLAISITTAFYLRSQTPMHVVPALGRVIYLLLFVAETSLVASLVDIAAILVYWLTKTNFTWVGLLVLMPGVFANTLLAGLNTRGHLSDDIQHHRTLKIGDNLINECVKRPPIMITISKKVEKRSEGSPV